MRRKEANLPVGDFIKEVLEGYAACDAGELFPAFENHSSPCCAVGLTGWCS